MLLELQVRQVHIHILLVIWGLAEEEEETSQLKWTWLNSNTTQIFFEPPPAPIFFNARAEMMKEWWQSTPAQNGDGYGTPLHQTMVMGMALYSSKQWLWVAMECVKQLL